MKRIIALAAVVIMLAMLVPLTAEPAEAAAPTNIQITPASVTGYNSGYSSNYNTVWSKTTGTDSGGGGVGNSYIPNNGGHYISRCVIWLPRSQIPTSGLFSASLDLYITEINQPSYTNVVVIQGASASSPATYPCTGSNYNQAIWSGNYGSISTRDVSRNEWAYPNKYVSIKFNDAGISYLKSYPGDMIPICLRMERDINKVPSTDNYWHSIKFHDLGGANPPRLNIVHYPELEYTSQPSVANIIKTVDGRTVTASTVAENYTRIVWDMGDGTIYEGVTTVQHTYADNGTYTVTVTAYDWLGQEASTSTAVQIGDTVPVMSINGAGMAVIAAAGSFVLALGAIARRPVMLIIGIAAIIIAALLALGVL